MCSSQATATANPPHEEGGSKTADFVDRSEIPPAPANHLIDVLNDSITSDGLGDPSGDAPQAMAARLRETSEKFRVGVTVPTAEGFSSNAKDSMEAPGTPKARPSEALKPFGSPFQCAPTSREETIAPKTPSTTVALPLLPPPCRKPYSVRQHRVFAGHPDTLEAVTSMHFLPSCKENIPPSSSESPSAISKSNIFAWDPNAKAPAIANFFDPTAVELSSASPQGAPCNFPQDSIFAWNPDTKGEVMTPSISIDVGTPSIKQSFRVIKDRAEPKERPVAVLEEPDLPATLLCDEEMLCGEDDATAPAVLSNKLRCLNFEAKNEVRKFARVDRSKFKSEEHNVVGPHVGATQPRGSIPTQHQKAAVRSPQGPEPNGFQERQLSCFQKLSSPGHSFRIRGANVTITCGKLQSDTSCRKRPGEIECGSPEKRRLYRWEVGAHGVGQWVLCRHSSAE